MSALENGVYRFADCELDPVEHRLRVHGLPVALTPKVFDTLVLLVERAGHVVGKDELIAALWPRGFVHESNLTKHIWLLRRALGDDGEASRYIETVPKLGYRFIAGVERVTRAEPALVPAANAAAADGTAPGATVPPAAPTAGAAPLGRAVATTPPTHPAAPRRLHKLAFAAVALLAIVLATGIYRWHTTGAEHLAAPPGGDAQAIALTGFNNLAGRATDAWLGPALNQMLGTEVAATGALHAVPAELVRPARAALPVPGAGGYAPSSLATLRHRLGARYVMAGAFLVTGTADAAKLRVDITVQDTQSGRLVATLAQTAALSDLPGLAARLGADLRAHLGDTPIDPALSRQIAAAQPPSADVARHIGLALQALDRYDPARARDELLQAIAQSPGYAPAYLYLSHAWSMLGYRAKALAAAAQAAQGLADLPREQQLQVRAWQATLANDAAQASRLRGELASLRPGNPAYRLQWIGALVAAGNLDAASHALAQAHSVPALLNDPRLALVAARLASAQGKSGEAIRNLRLAMREAQQRDSTGIAAEAALQLGIALGQDKQAEPMLRAAIAGYHRIGNLHGEAHAWQNLGNLQSTANQLAAARQSYQRAMTIYQAAGDLGGEAAIYENLSNLLWQAGDRDGTAAALRQAIVIARETADKVQQAWSLAGLATVTADDSASDDAAAMYREAIALDRETGESGHLVFTLANLADLLRMRGQLAEAQATCAQAQAAQRARATATPSDSADFECAQVALDRGDVATAKAAFTAIASRAQVAGDGFTTANAQSMLGQIALGEQRWKDARDALQQATAGWAAMHEVPGEATGSAMLALCADALHDDATRDRLAAHARALRGGVTARAEVFELDVALAMLQAAEGHGPPALAALQALAADAAKRHWPGLGFEARLATVAVTARTRGATGAQQALIADARAAGYGWVGQRAALLR